MSAAVQSITTDIFQTEVLNASVPVVVDFWAPWCGPCRMVAPEMEKASGLLGSHAKIVKVNVDENPALATRYGVMSIPTLIIFHQGKEIGRHVGVISGDVLAKSLKDYLGVPA